MNVPAMEDWSLPAAAYLLLLGVLTLCLIVVFECRCAVEGLMNLPVIEDLWTVLAPLPLAMSILPAGNDSGFPSAGQRVTCQLCGPERPYASPMHAVMRPGRGRGRLLSGRPSYIVPPSFRDGRLSQAGARACLTCAHRDT